MVYSISKEYYDYWSKCNENDIRIYANQKNQIIVERRKIIEKIFNLKRGDNVTERIMEGYKYYFNLWVKNGNSI